MTYPAGQTAIGRSPVREEPQTTNTCNQHCWPDRTRQVAGQGGAANHKHMQPTLPARPHSAGRQSGRSHKPQTHVTNPAGKTALGRSPVREEPQTTNTCDQPCRPDHTRQVSSQGGATTHMHAANPADKTTLKVHTWYKLTSLDAIFIESTIKCHKSILKL